MRTYIFLMRNNAGGAKMMLASGNSGATEQARAVEALDGEVVSQWAVTGRFDAVLVARLPDDAAAVALTLGATSIGQYMELLSALDPEELDTVRLRHDQAVVKLAGEEIAGAAGPHAEATRESGGSDE